MVEDFHCKDCGIPLMYPEKPCPKCGCVNDDSVSKIIPQEKLDFKHALKSPFSGSKWWLKLLPYYSTLALIITAVIILEHSPILSGIIFLFSIIPSLFVTGFDMQFAHNEIHGNTPLLPEWKPNLKSFIKYALKYFVILFAYIVMGLIIGIPIILGDNPVLTLLSIILYIVVGLPVFILSFIAFRAFADTFCLKDAFNFSRVWALVKKVKEEIVIALLFWIVLEILVQILEIILKTNFVGIVLIPLIRMIKSLTIINIGAQVYKIAKYRLQGVQN